MTDPQTRFIDIAGQQLAARLPDLGGHRIDTVHGAYGHVHDQMVTLHLKGADECQGCGAKLRLNPQLTLTPELLDDPNAQIPAHVSSFDPASRSFTVLESCPVPGPEHYSVDIEVPSGKVLVRNVLTRDKRSPLHYELEYADGRSINCVAGCRHRTRHCADRLGYAIVSTTEGTVDLWRLGPDALQLGGPGIRDDGYGAYQSTPDGGEDWIDLPEPGEFLGSIDIGTWCVELIDLELFEAAGGSLEDLEPHMDQVVVDLTPGTYRFTVMNEALEDWQCDRPGAFEPPLGDRVTARLELTRPKEQP